MYMPKHIFVNVGYKCRITVCITKNDKLGELAVLWTNQMKEQSFRLYIPY